MREDLGTRTIRDFGQQWNAYSENEGFYASTELFFDAFPLLEPADVEGVVVADVGSGTGRIVKMLLAIGAKHVYAVEPSSAFDVLQENLKDVRDRVTCLNLPCEELDLNPGVDLVVSYGVFHHIPEPATAVRAAYNSLKPGRKICLWLYGKEGNELYLGLVNPMRYVTTRLPHSMLVILCWILYPVLVLYLLACRILPVPLRDYMTTIVAQLNAKQCRLVIYDQLNPAYAKYYTGDEACELLRQAGFTEVKHHQRHGYSWTVAGVKPIEES